MKRFTAVLLMLLATTTAQAQKAGPHGGLLAGKGGHDIELVVAPAEITIYVVADGEAHSTKGLALRAIVQSAGKSATIELVDSGGEKLVGKLAAPLAKGDIVVVTGKDDHGDAVSARYSIK
jgi:hypothetical protein